jgi:hypothetical protein
LSNFFHLPSRKVFLHHFGMMTWVIG